MFLKLKRFSIFFIHNIIEEFKTCSELMTQDYWTRLKVKNDKKYVFSY